MAERVVSRRAGPTGPAELLAAARRRGLALRGYAYEPAQAGPPGAAWPAQPPTRGRRRWLRPKRILATLVVVLAVASALHALGHGGYEFKTKAPMSVHVYIYMHLHGIDALPTVFARFAAIRLSGPQPEVTWTLMRILDRAGVMASR